MNAIKLKCYLLKYIFNNDTVAKILQKIYYGSRKNSNIFFLFLGGETTTDYRILGSFEVVAIHPTLKDSRHGPADSQKSLTPKTRYSRENLDSILSIAKASRLENGRPKSLRFRRRFATAQGDTHFGLLYDEGLQIRSVVR